MENINWTRFVRISAYFLIGVIYLIYLSLFAPLGVDWLDWHAQRIFNAAEYLRLNGYLSTYGFSIWTSCTDCGFDDLVAENLYLSASSLPLSPYILINHFGGKEALLFYGPLLDKVIIFFTGILISELGIKFLRSYLPSILVGIGIFILFISSPWTYKMMIAAWSEIFFLFFFLTAMVFINYEKNRMGLFLFFMSGIFNYIWAAIIGFFYLLILILPNFIKDSDNQALYPFSYFQSNFLKKFSIPIALIAPLFLQLLLKIIASFNVTLTSGSSLLTRIGITGSDLHNGGILGALQFLAGNRVSVCMPADGSSIISENINNSIFIFNCSLSLIGMFFLSILSVFGIVSLILKSKSAKKFLIPIIFALVVFVMFFQQALSAHLMGFSYPFSFIFAIGIASFIHQLSKYFSSQILNIIFVTPLIFGIAILSTRVSFLTGLNG